MSAPTPAQPETDDKVRLAGLSITNPRARRLLGSRPPGTVDLDAVPVLAVLTTERVALEQVGARAVPQLRIAGRLDSLVMLDAESMPYRIAEVGLPGPESCEVDLVYRFTTEQLQDMVGKGLYLEGFGPPEQWTNIPMEIPALVDISVLAPLERGEPPLVVVDNSPLRVIETSLEHSRYDFAEGFPDYRKELREAGVLSELDSPGEQVSAAELTGYDFGEGVETTLPPVKTLREQLADPTALREHLEELLGERLRAPDQLRLLRANTPDSGEAARLARGRMGSRADEEASRAFNEALARRRAELAGVGASVEEEYPDLSEVDLESDVDLSDFDFGDLDLEQDTEAAPAVDDDMDAIAAAALAADARQHEQDAELTASVGDDELAEMDESELADTEGDDEQDKARKAALRRRLVALRRAREAAARTSAVKEGQAVLRAAQNSTSGRHRGNDGPGDDRPVESPDF